MSDVSSTWTALVGAALVGTDRKAFVPPSAGGSLGAAIERTAGASDDDAGRLLRSAAVAAAYRRAGALPPRDEESAVPPAEPEACPAAPAEACVLLRRILAGEHAPVLPEWLALAAARRVHAPADTIPALLELGRHTPAVREQVLEVIGARGRWLAGYNPEWSYAAGAGDDVEQLARLCETAVGAARLVAFRRLRRLDPERGRALLEETWAQESPADRAAFIAALADGLSAADEPFLEHGLDDRRKEVRQGAQALLVTLPDSALNRRMAERARGLISRVPGRFLQRARVEVRLPDAPDPALVRDGIEPKPPAGIGERAWWLSQLVAAVPPRVWSAEVGMEPRELLRFAAHNEWRDPVVAGLLRGTERFRDSEWAEALWESPAPGHLDAQWRAPAPMRVFVTVVPPARVDALLRERIESEKTALRGADPVLVTLVAWPHGWSEALARAVARRLRELVAGDSLARLAAYEFHPLLQRCAHAVPASATPFFTDGWPEDAAAWSAWADQIDAMSCVLRFRRAVHLAFTEEQPS